MKIAIITDTHWGSRGDKTALHDHFINFYRKVFFPYIEKEGIDIIWHLGDLVDRRKFINFQTLELMRKEFLDKLKGKEVHIILGNHDMYYKNKVHPNALEELLKGYDFKVYYEATEVNDILVVPWICDENESQIKKAIKKSKAPYCFGHLQLRGFEMDRGNFADEGEEADGFGKFDMVLTGHFHHKSSYNNIFYLGAPYEMTWSDYDDARGFHIFDTETRELTYVKNPYKLFYKFVYDDKVKLNDEDLKYINNCFVKVVVKNKSNLIKFEQFMDKIISMNPADVQIVEDHFNLNLDSDEDLIDQAEDTLTILDKYIEGLDTEVDKAELKKLFKTLYDEAALVRI